GSATATLDVRLLGLLVFGTRTPANGSFGGVRPSNHESSCLSTRPTLLGILPLIVAAVKADPNSDPNQGGLVEIQRHRADGDLSDLLRKVRGGIQRTPPNRIRNPQVVGSSPTAGSRNY